ncbi:MAG: YicC family protein [Bryobacterales bacterium]|nr:YicC family protein [Bryobacterales bacterium]
MAEPIRSMTGFARVSRDLPEGKLSLSLRAVNHRSLDLHFHLPAELEPFEAGLRKLFSGKILRGHIDVRAQFVPAGTNAVVRFNQPLLAAYVAAFRQAATEFGLKGDPDLNAALRIPGMLADSSLVELEQSFEPRLQELLTDAVDTLNAERSREGQATGNALRDHASRIRVALEEIERLRANIVPALQSRLQDRLTELLGGNNLDMSRLAQEAAFLADRSDIAEEITRLKIHHTRLLAMLGAGGEIGKKLDFLLQEMNRETTTILSKSNAAGESGRRLTELALQIKSEIEKIREQSLNLE